MCGEVTLPDPMAVGNPLRTGQAVELFRDGRAVRVCPPCGAAVRAVEAERALATRRALAESWLDQ